MQRASRASVGSRMVCPLCNGNLNFREVFSTRCKNCGSYTLELKCDTPCKFYKLICKDCSLKSDRLIPKEKAPQKSDRNYSYRWIIALGMVFLVSLAFWHRSNSGDDKSMNNLFKKLKIKYPSQRNDTWYHLLSVLESEHPSVKSITFLHNEEMTTLDCLISELIFQFSGDKKIKVEEITFSGVGFEEVDYGIVLDHYHAIVKKYRVFKADLTEVPGKFARIFHSLCDEVSSDIKPSLFIFTIKVLEINENLKPLERATAVLKQSWNDLPGSELHPLLSRVVKNVVEIVPERGGSCFSEDEK